MIVLKRKQLMARFGVACPDAAGTASASGDPPPADAVKALDSATVCVSVPGVDMSAASSEVHAVKQATPSVSAAPHFPYPSKDSPADTPAVIYWTWFRKALGRRLRDAAAAVKCTKGDVLRDPSAAGLRRTCAETLLSPLSEAEVAHLECAPVSAAWLSGLLRNLEFPRVEGREEELDDSGVVVVDGNVDYTETLEKFGLRPISDALLARLEKLTVGRGRVKSLHPWLRRGIFYSHRDLDQLCDLVERGRRFYIYACRGPSASPSHLGHLVPLMMAKWLQDAFNAPVVVQLTEDEKFLWQGHWDPENGDDLEKFQSFTTDSVKDIIALGFDKKKTFVFTDLDYVGNMYANIVRIWKATTYRDTKACFGLQGENNIGQSAFFAMRAASCIPSSFQVPLGEDDLCCLVPCAIDQDPHFQMTRNVASKLVPKSHPLAGKPALLHARFFPALLGAGGKMSDCEVNAAVYLKDTADEISTKVQKYAFSGGRATAKEQKEKGADLNVDVSYQWLRFFLEDDAELERIAQEYGTGQGDYWNTASVKTRLVQELQKTVGRHQKSREEVTTKEVEEWTQVRKLKF